MTGRTELLYNAILGRILEVYRQHVQDPGFAVRLMISDYETAIMNAMVAAFPGAEARGCWFHYGQVSN